MNTEKNNTLFKFRVYYNDQLASEAIFDGDMFNHITRYSVNIRDISKDIVADLQDLLSKPTNSLNLFKTKKDKFNYSINHFASSKESKNTFKYVLMLDERAVITREFSVYEFNLAALYSVDLYTRTQQWGEYIQSLIVEKDRQLMWEEYELTQKYSISYSEVRNLDSEKREKMLADIHLN